MKRSQANAVTEPGAGLWWCLTCQAPADLEEPGEPFPRCARCGERRVNWVTQGQPERRLRPPAILAPPEEAAPFVAPRRLPADRRPSLSRMFAEGYLFCLGCEQVTELAEDGGCALCGSSQVERRGPAAEGGQAR